MGVWSVMGVVNGVWSVVCYVTTHLVLIGVSLYVSNLHTQSFESVHDGPLTI